MRKFEVEKWYLEARQAPSQTVSSFTAYLDQLDSQLLLPISELQQARDLLHRLQPNISQEIIQLANVTIKRFEIEALAIRIEETICNYRCQVRLPTRNNYCQKGPFKSPTQGLKIVQLPFCKRITDGSSPTTTTTAAQTNTQATPPAE